MVIPMHEIDAPDSTSLERRDLERRDLERRDLERSDLERSALERRDLERSDLERSALERRGRRWLIWSFIFCPCHLPLSMVVLAALFGGTAFGSLVSRNALGTGIVLGAIYLTGVAIGFRYLRRATKGIDCSDGACTL